MIYQDHTGKLVDNCPHCGHSDRAAIQRQKDHDRMALKVALCTWGIGFLMGAITFAFN